MNGLDMHGFIKIKSNTGIHIDGHLGIDRRGKQSGDKNESSGQQNDDHGRRTGQLPERAPSGRLLRAGLRTNVDWPVQGIDCITGLLLNNVQLDFPPRYHAGLPFHANHLAITGEDDSPSLINFHDHPFAHPDSPFSKAAI